MLLSWVLVWPGFENVGMLHLRLDLWSHFVLHCSLHRILLRLNSRLKNCRRCKLHLLCIEAKFVGLKIYFKVANAFYMDSVLLWFYSFDNGFCCVGDIAVLSLLLSCCKLRLTLISHISIVIPRDDCSVAYLASFMDMASRIGSIEL